MDHFLGSCHKVIVHVLALGALAGAYLLMRGDSSRRRRLDTALTIGGFFVAVMSTWLTMASAQDALEWAAEHNTLGCPVTWLQSLVPASYWATPAIALFLDASISMLLRRVFKRGWSPVFTIASLILQIIGAMYIIEFRYVYGS